ncbi:MAG TPA: NAD-binding protein [Pseudohongiella sp.]|nr:NAD-binding protein [Pseudohongiella sp.]
MKIAALVMVAIGLGATTAAHSKILEKKIANAGGFFVEAPVSGSRKPAENAELIVMTAGDPGLIQRVTLSFARSKGLNVRDFVSLLDISQMASDISRIKSKKFVENDFSRQAAIRDVLENCSLIVEEAAASGVSTPLMNHCHALYNTAHAAGLGDQDMIAVTQIFNRH